MPAHGTRDAREIRLNAFAMNCIGHQLPGFVDASKRSLRPLQHARLLG